MAVQWEVRRAGDDFDGSVASRRGIGDSGGTCVDCLAGIKLCAGTDDVADGGESRRARWRARRITAQQFQRLIERKTVIAVGPGLGEGPGTEILLEAVLSDTKLPVVIDADGLNTLAANSFLMEKMTEVAKSGRDCGVDAASW